MTRLQARRTQHLLPLNSRLKPIRSNMRRMTLSNRHTLSRLTLRQILSSSLQLTLPSRTPRTLLARMPRRTGTRTARISMRAIPIPTGMRMRVSNLALPTSKVPAISKVRATKLAQATQTISKAQASRQYHPTRITVAKFAASSSKTAASSPGSS